jgi:hypothetical protein
MKLNSPRKPRRRDASRALAACLVAFALGATVLLPACGGSSKQRSDASTGKQLSNLRQSYESGVITREEYERERRRILEGQ